MSRLPNLIIAGVNKAGTTSLFSYLAKHPDIGVSSVKETCYYLLLRYGRNTDPISVYKKYFNNVQDRMVVLESTPGYFYGGPSLINRINEDIPGVKILLVLRDPVDRFFSFYKFKKNMLELDEGITAKGYYEKCMAMNASELSNDAFNAYFGLEGGLYYKYIDQWIDVFDKRLKVMFFDDLKSSPNMAVKNVCDWMSIDYERYPQFSFDIENKTVAYKNRTLQKLALGVNQSMEGFFRANPSVKRVLRDLYYSVNSSSGSDSLPMDSLSEVKTLLRQYYSEPNSLLKTCLMKQDADIVLPSWIQ